jgi:hypothetical protein
LVTVANIQHFLTPAQGVGAMRNALTWCIQGM